MTIAIDITGYLPTWSSKFVKKIWSFRDYLTFHLGGHDHYPTIEIKSDTQLLLSFQSPDEADRLSRALNKAKIGVVVTTA